MQPPILTGQVSGIAGEPLPGVAITVTDPRGHQLLHTRTDKNGEYAATGFHDGFAIVVAGAPAGNRSPRGCTSATPHR
ncbi:carboxypeptidase-like regulatory domain-containing protein [Actinoallomurus sp. NPDC052308]|uniref:carboxypeptidase-like regulatory domain-containing protein n=1 Tax=Actinoallomurus sp. NPDC052308 TaxID=3155530 RepID=UPI00343C7FC3